MSNRKLLVATRGGGLAELVDSDCALVSEIGNAQSLTAAIAAAVDLFAAQHKADRDRLLDAAQAKSARFSITPINQELAKCYRAVLKQ
jgi:glycosyltransferase involved in cell wall biosynthesis